MSDEELPPGLVAAIEAAAPLAARFLDAGHRIYFVGGVVRDELLGRERAAQDLDATTDARPERIKAIVRALADSVWSQGERFGTIGCTIGERTYEITTHRADAYDPDSRKPAVSFGDSIDDDLARRDFTVNAMAVDLHTGELIDPHGGRVDLSTATLRTPLAPEISFSEDPLRMLRAARFHAGYSLVPDPAITSAMTAMVDRMEIVSAERIRDEIQKLIGLERPGPGLRLLAETGLLARVIPRLAGLDADAVERLADGVGSVPSDPAMRWAALLAPTGIDPGDLRALRFSGPLTRDVVWFGSAHDWARTPGSRSSEAPALRRDAALTPRGRHLSELHDWVAGLRDAAGLPTEDLDDHRAALGALSIAEPDLADPEPILDGDDVCALLGIEPGPQVGEALRWLRDLRIEEGPIPAEEAAARLAAWWPSRAPSG